MNTGNMLKLADFLENLPDYRFNISFWFSQANVHLFDDGEVMVSYEPIDDFFPDDNGESPVASIEDCNTSACVAGWASILANNGKFDDAYAYDAKEVAKEFLGLNTDESNQIFFWDRTTLWYKYRSDLGVDLAGDEDYPSVSEDSIKPIAVSKLLRGLVYGEFRFNKPFSDYYPQDEEIV